MALPTASDNPFPSFLAVETAAASISSPASGKQRLFVDTDHVLKYKNSGGTVSSVGGGAGASSLVYRYTVAGSDKASIDTGVDTPDAGSADWTNGDVLEIIMLIQTDDVAARAVVDLVVNNDGSSIYDLITLKAIDTTVSGVPSLADSRWQVVVHGSAGSTSYPGSLSLTMPGFSSTTFWKAATLFQGIPDATAGNNEVDLRTIGYRATTAVTRFKVAAQSTAKLKVGSKLLVYKRTAS